MVNVCKDLPSAGPRVSLFASVCPTSPRRGEMEAVLSAQLSSSHSHSHSHSFPQGVKNLCVRFLSAIGSEDRYFSTCHATLDEDQTTLELLEPKLLPRLYNLGGLIFSGLTAHTRSWTFVTLTS